MRAIRLLAIDLDGTLLDADCRLADGDAAALHEAAGDVSVVIATGRTILTVEPYVARLPVNAPWVLANGCLIVQWPGPEIQFERLLDTEVALQAAAVMRACGLSPVVYDNPRRSTAVYMESEPEDIRRYIERNRARLRFVGSVDERLDLPTLCVLTASQDEGLIRRAAGELERALGDAVRLMTMPSGTYRHWAVEVLPAVCSKAEGVHRVAEKLGVEPWQIAAFGDEVNDLSMLEYAGTAVAMAHAPADVRAAADVIAEPDEAGRIATAVRRVLRATA